ncbi:hypothetical protein M0R88_07890 [Halorussus gelatinilyticus]|uniref:Uncharacterized protein n=1 Tax=Halorussus gelatinilyticus TaxID=2937524 RepID=A0A8U0IPC9_9EURY|nr:hypothetical protein [Halorussus gelatinilyticus]UPW02004.1 hypothetical protein M0R88_07890 [Halorussus gelatinilyticus]
MTDATDYDPVGCPVSDCEYRDAVRSVAAHVAEADDDAHEWDRLGYAGARNFVETEKRRQRQNGGGGSNSSSDGGSSDPSSNGGPSTGESSTGENPRDPADGAAGSGGFTAASQVSGSDAGSSGGKSEPSGGGSDTADAADETPFELGFERDALVLLELAREYDLSSLDDLGTWQLADLYSLLADLKNSADDARKEVRDELLENVREERTVAADLGSVSRTTYNYRRVADETTVHRALADAGVDPEEVRSFDKSKLKDAIEETDLEEDDVFDVDERPTIRISDSHDDQRRRHFERLDDEVRSLADDE